MHYPDPILSANVYASGNLDGVLQYALRPFLGMAQERHPDREGYLWTMRYGCGGEHLKIRLHGPAEEGEALRETLGEAIERSLADLGPAPEPENRAPTPPIDVEDSQGPHDDRSWLWTTYQRDPISLGNNPFLSNDGYVARLTRCLGAACEVAVEALDSEADSATLQIARHNTLTQLVLEGLAALGFNDAQRQDYLYFHRDWLIRFPLLKSNGTLDRAREMTHHFDSIREQMPAEMETLGELARTEWQTSNTDADAWRRSLADFWSYTASLCEEPEYHLDPFASMPIFTPVFKVFHATANQLGLSSLEEALVHHLLAAATAPESVRLEVLFEPA